MRDFRSKNPDLDLYCQPTRLLNTLFSTLFCTEFAVFLQLYTLAHNILIHPYRRNIVVEAHPFLMSSLLPSNPNPHPIKQLSTFLNLPLFLSFLCVAGRACLWKAVVKEGFERRGIIVYIEYQSVCPFVGIGSPLSPSPSSLGPWGSNTPLRVMGGTNFRRLDRTPGTSYTLWV